MADSIGGMLSSFGKQAPKARKVAEQVPYASGTVSVPKAEATATYTEQAPGTQAKQEATSDMFKGALVKGGVSLATSAIMNAMNKPKDAEKEYIRARVDAQNRASAGAEKMAKRKREGGFRSTISKTTKVGGSSLAE